MLWNSKNQDTKNILSSTDQDNHGRANYLDNSDNLIDDMADFSNMSNSRSSSDDEKIIMLDDSRRYTFELGKSIGHVTLNMALHFYQLAPKDRVNIKFTGTDWGVLIGNSIKLKLYNESNSTSRLIVAKTPSGSDCLWICGDDEKSQFFEINYDADELKGS